MDLQGLSWENFFWIMGAIGTIIILLLSIISYFARTATHAVNKRLDKHEEWIISQQKEIRDISEQNKLAIQAIRINQEQNTKRISILEDSFDVDLADKIVQKIRAITPQSSKKKKE